jgi:hypothetical protein
VNIRTILAAVIGLGLVGAAVAGGWYVLRGRPPAFCELSGRPIHGNMHTLVKVNGKTRHACCARCALILGGHTDQKIEILEVTDYVSGGHLPASDAYYVEGSRVEVCSAPRLRIDESRTPFVRLFDRCSPSLLTFARADEAREFIANYGGSLKRLEELLQEAIFKRSPAGER